MPISDVRLGISDGGAGGAGGGAGGAPGFVATPAVPVMTLSGPAGLTTLLPDANGVPNYSVNGSAPAPIGASLIAPFATRRVVSAGVMEVGGIRILPRLLDWKKADRSMVTMTGTWPTVGSWLDKSGNGNTETATGTPQWIRSAINGRPGIRFASGSYFSATSGNLVSAAAQRTVIAVCKPGAVGGRIRTFRVATPQFICEYLSNGGSTFVYGNGVSTNATLAANPTIAATPVILHFAFDASASGADDFIRVRVNGVDQGIVNGPTTSEAAGTQGWVTGSDIANQPFNFDDVMCELFTFDGLLSWKESEALHTDLDIDYAITSASPLQVLPFGDSRVLGSGDATTLSKGGWRSYVSAQRPNFQFVGGTYAPHSTFGEADNKRAWARCETHPGFTSGQIVPPATGQGVGGPQLDAYLTTQGMRPRLIIMQSGQNDPGKGIAAAQTAANIADMCDQVRAIDDTIQIVVMAASKRRSNNTSDNATIVAQRALVTAAIAGKPNVLGQLIIPTDIPDSNYVDDDHTNDAGYQVIAADWIAGLTAVGY